MPVHAPYSPEFLVDPYDTLAELQRTDPVARVRLFGFVDAVLITRHADGRRVLTDPRFQMSLPGERGPFEPPLMELNAPATLANSGPEDHARLRRLMMQGFAPRRLDALRPRVAALVDRVLDEVSGRPEIELVGDVARPVALGVIGEILGVPEHERAGLPDQVLGSRPNRSQSGAELEQRNRETMRRADEYLAGLVAAKRARPGDDVTSALIQAHDGADRLTEQELRYALMSLLIAGFITSLNLVAVSIAELVADPVQRGLLAADPGLGRWAVEEACRFEPPFLSAVRVAAEDVDLGRVAVAKGDVVVISLNAVNRDEGVFPGAHRFDITRQPNPHLAFGHGAHTCLGAAVARMEAQITCTSFLRRFPRAAPAEAATRFRSDGIVRGPAAVRIRMDGG